MYESTRDASCVVNSAAAIKMGISPEGGLFVPTEIPKLTLAEIGKLAELNYRGRAVEILNHYLTDYTEEAVKDCVEQAYTKEKFGTDNIAPLYALNDSCYILELWHGPTCAFKDMALQILPHFMTKAMEMTGEDKEIVILVATSGDTGKAALEGFSDVKGTKIAVFYPKDGVSDMQRLQMVTTLGENVSVMAVKGNFDDAQNGVKQLFTDEAFIARMAEGGCKLSSANSINWGRLVPQIVYYFSAYADLLKNNQITLGDEINVVVPTGNFGNILAAYFAKEMGLPIHKLICASNENNVLTDFIRTGKYDRNRDFKLTASPSMDILISSNLERLLFLLSGKDHAKVNEWMKSLKETGAYEVDADTKAKISDLFWAGFADDEKTFSAIHDTYETYRYVMDTHTAVAKYVYDAYVKETGDTTKAVIASTASPFKFSPNVLKSLDESISLEGLSEMETLKVLSEYSETKIPVGLSSATELPVRFDKVIERTEMEAAVSDWLEL